MRGRGQERFEAAVDHCAAAALGLAAGWSGFVLLGTRAAGGLAILAWLIAFWALRRVEAVAPRFQVRTFSPRALDLAEPEEQAELLLTEQVELVLTDADRVKPERADVLLLDDILAELGPDSRVVRLFDRSAMPTPGQLNARIERHLRDSAASPPDASQALHEALAELRRSLR